jgi:hypothetical protein
MSRREFTSHSSDFAPSPPPGVSTMPTTAWPPAWHMDVLNRDLLLTLATMAVKRVDQSRVGARQFVELVQVCGFR